MNNYKLSHIEYVQMKLLEPSGDKWRWLVIPTGKTIGIVYPLSPTTGVIVLDPMKPYGHPIVFECQYTDLINKLQRNPRVQLVEAIDGI